MDALPLTSERLFQRYFLPLYPADAGGGPVDLAKLRATDENPAQNPRIFAQLHEAARIFARLAPRALDAADLVLDFTDASVHHLSERLTRERRDAWLAPGEGSHPPLLVNLVTHGALYVGACVVASHGGVWQVRRPMWESTVRLASNAGTGDLAVFHWWLKALSDEEVGKGRLADRYRTHVEVPTFDPKAMVPIAPPTRKLPRLAKVRYDLLYKYLRAHLPELRDVGADFPSPERIEELAFKWLDFLLLGDGGLLLLHGPTDRGVHLFWLDLGGFVKSAYYPADAFPAHIVEAQGDILRVIVSIQGKPVVHEMLYWGA